MPHRLVPHRLVHLSDASAYSRSCFRVSAQVLLAWRAIYDLDSQATLLFAGLVAMVALVLPIFLSF